MSPPHARIPLTLMLFLYTVYKEKGASVQGAPLAAWTGKAGYKSRVFYDFHVSPCIFPAIRPLCPARNLSAFLIAVENESVFLVPCFENRGAGKGFFCRFPLLRRSSWP